CTSPMTLWDIASSNDASWFRSPGSRIQVARMGNGQGLQGACEDAGYRRMETSSSCRSACVGAFIACLVLIPATLYSATLPALPRAEGLTAFSAGARSAAKAWTENERPVIAILASDCGILYNCSSYIPASYVQLLQQGGAQVVPLYPGMKEEEFDHVLSHVNGVMTIGGFFKMNGTADVYMRKIYDHVVSATKRGEIFPFWATCVGIHDMVQLVSGKVYADFLTRTYAENLALPLHFEPSADLKLLFDEEVLPGSSTLRRWLSDEPLTFHHHQWGITPSTFHGIKELRDGFRILATSEDRSGTTFISLLQGRQHPLFASAFHPEKPAFEWGYHTSGLLQNTAIPHSRQVRGSGVLPLQ
ncbi:Gamma-glutamyl hydrolase A (Conjugase A) (GH A) (Gamma-Glu-X carboxypeptidase A), partial [Durusdinium trenchii]